MTRYGVLDCLGADGPKFVWPVWELCRVPVFGCAADCSRLSEVSDMAYVGLLCIMIAV